MSEVPSTTISLSLNGPNPILVAVAATDNNGDSGILSNMLEVTAHPQIFSLLSPDYLPRDVVIVTDPANGGYILKWRQPAILPDDLQVSMSSVIAIPTTY